MARFTLGQAYLKLDQKSDANQQFEKIIEHFSGLIERKDRFAEGHYFIGRSYFFMQKFDRAVEFLSKAIEYDTEAVDFHFSFGMSYSDADAFFALAEAQTSLGDKKAARTNLEKALAQKPHDERFLALQKQLY